MCVCGGGGCGTYLQEVKLYSCFALILCDREELHKVMVANIGSQGVSVLVYCPLTAATMIATIIILLLFLDFYKIRGCDYMPVYTLNTIISKFFFSSKSSKNRTSSPLNT